MSKGSTFYSEAYMFHTLVTLCQGNIHSKILPSRVPNATANGLFATKILQEDQLLATPFGTSESKIDILHSLIVLKICQFLLLLFYKRQCKFYFCNLTAHTWLS